ncbi:FERM domain-containing protein 4A-like isoform X3 [Penaeus vannamei]|uniref:FERM domain-containing protein 4A-like isoform X3 n=1 Tax=Penaeus vannamei TaxID=6689 RepID=UPI00387F5544
MSRERIERRKLWLQMSVGVRVEVVLLDDRRLQVGVGPRLLTQELLAMVASHFTLKEHQYFSLAVVDNTGHYQWLTHDRRVVDHDVVRALNGAPVTMYFLVK